MPTGRVLPGHGASDVANRFDDFNASYDDLVLALKRERDAQEAEIAAAWEEIERARSEIRSEWDAIQQERRRLFPSTGGEMPSFHHHDEFSAGGAAASIAYRGGTGSPAAGYNAARQTASSQQHQHQRSLRGTLSRQDTAVLHSPPSVAASHRQTSASAVVAVWSGLSKGPTVGQESKRLVVAHFRTMKQLLERAAVDLGLQPASDRIYSPSGEPIYDLRDLVDGGDYVVLPSGCRYREDTVPTQLLRKLVAADAVVNHVDLEFQQQRRAQLLRRS